MLYSALWSTANWMPAITSRTVALPSSSETLIETRLASGATPMKRFFLRVAGIAALGVTGDDAGDVRAVAVAVGRRGGVRMDHGRADHAGALVGVGDAEVREVAGDAGVDHRDTHAAAGAAVRVPQIRRLDRLVVARGDAVALRLRLRRGVRRHRADLGARGELAGAGGRQLGGDGVDDVQVTRDLAPQLADERRRVGARRARVELDDDLDALARRALSESGERRVQRRQRLGGGRRGLARRAARRANRSARRGGRRRSPAGRCRPSSASGKRCSGRRRTFDAATSMSRDSARSWKLSRRLGCLHPGDPWLCVPASRRVCPTYCSSRQVYRPDPGAPRGLLDGRSIRTRSSMLEVDSGGDR